MDTAGPSGDQDEEDMEIDVINIATRCRQQGKGASRGKGQAKGKSSPPVAVKVEQADGDHEGQQAMEAEQQGNAAMTFDILGEFMDYEAALGQDHDHQTENQDHGENN